MPAVSVPWAQAAETAVRQKRAAAKKVTGPAWRLALIKYGRLKEFYKKTGYCTLL